MKIQEVIVESSDVNEAAPFGLGSRLGAAVKAKFGSAQAKGQQEIGRVANTLWKEFQAYLGRTNDRMTKKVILDFLRSQGYPTNGANKVLSKPRAAPSVAATQEQPTSTQPEKKTKRATPFIGDVSTVPVSERNEAPRARVKPGSEPEVSEKDAVKAFLQATQDAARVDVIGQPAPRTRSRPTRPRAAPAAAPPAPPAASAAAPAASAAPAAPAQPVSGFQSVSSVINNTKLDSDDIENLIRILNQKKTALLKESRKN